MKLSLLLPLSLALGAPLSVAQFGAGPPPKQPPPPPPGPSGPATAPLDVLSAYDDIRIPPTIVPPLQSVEIAQATGVHDRDLLIRSGGNLYVSGGLGRFGAIQQVANGVMAATSISMAPAGLPELPDLVLASTGMMFRRFSYQVSSGGFLELPALFNVAGLSNAALMQRAVFDTKGLDDLITVAGWNNNLVFGWSMGIDGTPAAVFQFGLTESIEEVDAIDWDGDGIDEIAVLTTTSVGVHGTDGSTLYSAPLPPGHTTTIEVMRGTASQPQDCLVWASKSFSTSPWEISIASPATTSNQGGLVLAYNGQEAKAIEVVGLRAGDADADGDLDLLISQRTFQSAIVLENIGLSGPVFGYTTDPQSYRHYEYVSDIDAPWVGASPLAEFADIDVDDRADVICPYEVLESIVIVRGDEADSPTGGGNQGFNGGDGKIGLLYDEAYGVDANDNWEGPYRLYLEIPDEVPLESFDHIQVQVWEQLAGNETLQRNGLANILFPVPEPGEEDSPRHIGVDVTWPGNAPIEGWIAGHNIFLTYRLVTASFDGQGKSQVHSGGRWYGAGMTLTDDLQNWWDTGYQDALRANKYLADLIRNLLGIDVGEGFVGIVLGITADVGRVGDFVNVPIPVPRSQATQGEVFYWVPPGD